MVTQPVGAVEPATPAAGMSYGARLALTVLLLSLYLFGHAVPLPFVDLEALSYDGSPASATLLVLRLGPLITGFLLVELFAVATSPGRRLRKGGPAGRAKLNRAALVTSLLLSALQAAAFGSALADMTSPIGAPTVSIPSWAFVFFLVVTLAAVTAAVFFLGTFVSEYGIGNGFSLLILAEVVWSLWKGMRPWINGESSSVLGSPISGLAILLAGILAGLVIRQFQEVRRAKIPAFPQGVVPSVLTGALVMALPVFFSDLSGNSRGLLEAAVALLLVPLFSLLTFHLFSSRPRLEANLSEPDETLTRISNMMARRLLPSMAVLTLGTAGWMAWNWYRPDVFTTTVSFAQWVVVVAIGFDLREQFLFLRRNGATVRLVQLDNVHFSYRLAAHLRTAGIDALARAHHFRSLFFFLASIVKIDVLVPKDQLDEAQAVLAELELAREIKVF